MNLYITRKIKDKYIAALKKKFSVSYNPTSNKLTKKEIIHHTKNSDAILSQLYDPIDMDVITNAKNLKMIANCAAGFNNINIEKATERNIIVTNTPGVLTDATADITLSLMLSVSRKIIESAEFLKKGKFKGWDLELLLGTDLTGKTLGIVGAGKIGSAVIKRAMGWDMKILYVSNSQNHDIEKKYNAVKTDLHYLLQQSDIVSLHCPLTDTTYHLLGKSEFNNMKKTAILINTARGAVINEPELIEALKTKEIAGAGLDVFEQEPHVPDELLSMENVVCLPHIGSATVSTREKMVEMSVNSLFEYFINKEKPKNSVN